MFKWREPDEKKYFPLTHPQKRVWYTEQITPGTSLFNLGGIMRIKGPVDPSIMEQVIQKVVERNDGLRLIIINDDGEPKQYVRELDEFTLPVYDFSGEPNPDLKAKEWLKTETKKQFSKGEYFAPSLVKLADDDYIYLHKIHHVIGDGWAFALTKQEFEESYQEILKGQSITETEKPSYLDFIQDEESYKESNRFTKHQDFWIENFQDLPQAINLSAKTASSSQLAGSRYTHQLDEEMTEKIKAFVKESGSSVYSFFTAILFTYMYRFTGAVDLIIGTPVLNRTNARQKDTLGMFVSTMPFRIQMEAELSFADFLKKIVAEQRRYYRNQRYPMDLLVKNLQLAQKGNQKLFEVSLSYQNMTYEPTFNGAPIELEWVHNGHEENSLDIHINDRMAQGELILDFDYAWDAFSEEDMHRLAGYFVKMAQEVIKDPEQPLKHISFMDHTELETLIYQWNQTRADYPKERTVAQLFEEQVKRQPEKVAVEYEDRKLTYAELNNQANYLAQELRAKGVQPDTLVGILIERSIEAVVGILAVLKAGGAYLPIDPDYPEERISFMLEDGECKILLTQSFLQSRVPTGYTGHLMALDEVVIDLEGDYGNLAPVVGSENMCYMIYTSGSTGRPKGVMVKHGGLTNYIWWAQGYYTPNGPANFPLYSSLSFDLTVTSIFTPLVSGCTIYILGNERGNLISDVVKLPNVNIAKLTPAHLSLLKEEDNSQSSVRKFIVGGEELKADLARQLMDSFGGDIEIYNEYGPTETVVGCIVYRFDPEESFSSVLIGTPIQNTTIYILDQELQPVPVGAVGEIYIAGDGVARGYHNRLQLTEERFLADPFVSGQRMYKSGDLGRYLPDGRIEYLGRVDNQVKIRGYRIEIGEVESGLIKNPEIKDAVVDVRKDGTGAKYLVGYFVSETELSVSDLRGYLLQVLPEYMVPTAFMQLEEIPLTSNGKVDRRALPEPDASLNTGTEYVAPETDLEGVLAEIWSEVLGREQVGVNDNFFDLGGDSIKAIQVSTRLKNRGLQCSVQDIFTYQIVSQVALHVTTDLIEIQAKQGILEGEVEATPIVKWFLNEELKDANYWNQSLLLKLNSNIDLPQLELAFNGLIKHHDGLRINVSSESGKLFYQTQHLVDQFQIAFYDLANLVTEDQDQRLVEYSKELKGNFDLTKSRLIKAAVFDLGQRGRRLLITIHHLVVDGISWRVLLEDLGHLYLNPEEPLPRKSTSYQEWAEALLEYSQSELLEKQIPYWEEILEANQFAPVDFIISDGDSRFGEMKDTVTCQIALSEEETETLLTKANESYNTEINDLLLTGLAKTFKSWMHHETMVLRLEGHGREELFPNFDLARTVGWFTSVYPVKLSLAGRGDLASQIKGIKEQLRQIPEKGIGYGILKYLTGHNFKFDESKEVGILFNYLGQFDQDLQADLFEFAQEDSGADVGIKNYRVSLLELNSMVKQGCLEITAQFSNQRLKEETVKELLSRYVEHLREIIVHCTDDENYGFTPSDFDTIEISEDDLDQLFG